MSSVTEVLQARGRFSIDLKPSTPLSLISRLGFFGHVFVTSSRLSADLVAGDLLYPSPNLYPTVGTSSYVDEYVDSYTSETGALFPSSGVLPRVAEWAGVIEHLPRGRDTSISGPGLEAWLGDDKAGHFVRTRERFWKAGPREVMERLLPVDVRPGTVFPTSSTFTGTIEANTSLREALDYILDAMGLERRINPDGTMDVGSPSQLFGTGLLYPSETLFPSENLFMSSWAPTALAVRKGGWDIDIKGLQVASLGLDADVEDYATDSIVIGRIEQDAAYIGTASETPRFRNLHGDDMRRTVLVHESAAEDVTVDDRARQILDEHTPTRHAVRLSLDDYELNGTARVGQMIGVYDPEADLYDLDNPVQWRGRTVFPLNLRVLSASWPIDADMGVYYRDPQGRVVDITDHVDRRGGDITLEVGATPRTLTALEERREALRARLRTGPLYHVPPESGAAAI